jgi:hypothetical protein
MTDDPNSQTPTPTPMTNSAEARTPTGEIIDQAAAPSATTPAPSPAAPETYTDFKLPEGVTLDKAILDEATPIFKELGLSQDAAQKLIDLQAKHSGKTAADLAKSVDDMRAEWQAQVKADPALANLDVVRTELGRAKDKLPATVRSAFDEAMNLTGLGDHPAVVRGLFEFAKLVNEGTPVNGAGPSPDGQTNGRPVRPTIAGALYPNLSQ